MKEYLKAMQKMQKHKDKRVFVVFKENGTFQTSVYGKITEVMSRILVIEKVLHVTASVQYENIIFILDDTGNKIFEKKDLGIGTEMK